MIDRRERVALLVALGAVLGLVAAFESGTSLRDDDFGYLMWSQRTPKSLIAVLRGPEWHTYFRPLNAVVWWVGGRAGLDGEVARWAGAGLWTTVGVALAVAARARALEAVAVALLLLTNQVFVDLLQWRSWLTTTGGLALACLALAALGRGASPTVVACLGLASAGFKELPALVVAVAALATLRYRLVGAAVAAVVLAGAVASIGKVGMPNVWPNVRFHLATLALFAPGIPVLLSCSVPRLHWGFVLCSAAVSLLPTPVAGVGTLVVLGLAVSRSAVLLPAFAVALSVPLLGSAQARQYMLEAWVLGPVALAWAGTLRPSAVALVACALGGLPLAVDFERARAHRRVEFDEQVQFLGHFHPLPADALYHPDTQWQWDLDALVWVRGGAELRGAPPQGTEPVQVGPRSGVWADVRPTQGNGSTYNEPDDAPP